MQVLFSVFFAENNWGLSAKKRKALAKQPMLSFKCQQRLFPASFFGHGIGRAKAKQQQGSRAYRR